ncbi:hypothetical protein BCV69DRAFT_283827 [Microstroma glucosiphilum]|uniref:phosphoribosylglycinamide formyltransferase 1 n=1 Tax=Pseudomicrostroma glucosiphilum TaxID=1684307 RepID=A0A316U5J2_9BASI|nr:hypothetical protein BCV69DRAFT_283827 [Pseudomicrostroma glucosiphilum]PWN19721.1 hypothetical protein BCV69DRAFT_283827 [Pseudomicrostroma glucosiphilum]
MATHDLISPSATGSSDWLNRNKTASTAAASDLEEEVRQSRLDRQNRRRRLSGEGIRGLQTSAGSHRVGEMDDMSPQHTGGSTTAGEKEATLRRLMSTKSQDGQDSSAAATSSSRASGLLSRYGGQAGPTGTADAGSGASPVSLASFMGGKAAGPRLGKLAGDGRSAPPEASLIDETRMRKGVALPGMAAAESPSSPGKGRGLASFLEARAGGLQQRSDALSSSPGGQSSPAARSPSPVRRAASPTKQIPFADTFKAPASPVKRSASPSKAAADVTSQPASARPSNISPSKAHTNTLSVSPMKDAATSPIQTEEIASSSFKKITPSGATATPSWRAPTSAPAATTSTNLPSPSRSPAFASPAFASKLASDKGPTPSLTRLQGKGMVGQRLKEAKEREAAASVFSSPSASPAPASPSKFPLGRTNSSGSSANNGQTPRWAAIDTSLSQRESEEGAPRANKWTPHRSGTALPGLSRADSTSSSGARALSPTRASTAPSSSGATDDRYDVAPVRLPGMGSARSPFGASAGRASPDKGKSAYFDGTVKEDAPLEHLTKGRAKGPARRSARGPTNEAAQKVETPKEGPVAPVADSSTPSAAELTSAPAPLRNTSGKRIVVLISGSGSNLQALIDATHKGGPLSHAQITYVLSNRKAAFGLQRAASSNPPIATKVLALKTWQNRNGGGTREQYDEVLAKAVLDAEGTQLPNYDESKPSVLPPPDLIVLAGFMHIVSPQFLRALGHRTGLSEAEAPSWRPSAPVPIINLHPALPGAFDGANAIPRAFEAFKEGKIKNTGIMVHEVIAEVDRGAPIVTKEVFIRDDDTLDALETRMHSEEHKLIVEGTRIMLSRAASGRTQTQQADQPVSPTKVDVKESIKSWGSTSGRSANETDTKSASARWGQSNSERPSSPTKMSRQIEQRPQPSRHVNLKLSESVSSLPSLSAQHKAVLAGMSPSARAVADQTVSVETLSLQSDGSTSTIASHEAHILYETETLAVVHRFRSSSSGQTVATKLYARAGHQASSSSQVAQKLSDLARRYSTSVIDARQGREDTGLVRALGGKVETRQGSRRGWDKSNSLMWRVQEQDGVIFIDQVDLSTSNLCSAYSYLLSIVGNLFVWYGKGSTALEREIVSAHAREIFGPSSRISEQEEGAEDKSFWNFLSKSEGYAQAWHFRHRNVLPELSAAPRLFHVSDNDVREHEGAFTAIDVAHEGIAVLVLPAEVYLLVGKDARSRRREIALGLSCAEHLGKAVVARRLPDLPSLPVHALIYPTLEPRDLVASLRYWEEGRAGNPSATTARRINIVSLATAKKELLNSSGKWRRETVRDRDYLPLGVGPGDL